VHDITVRQMAFEFPDALDPIVVADAPEESYSIIGLSLLLPYLEPYLIRTMKVAKKRVTDPELVRDMEAFSAQEGQHYRQHIRFNDSIRGFGFPGLEALERELEADYRRFSESKSLRWNLAYAEGFEALTTAGAYGAFEMGANPNMLPAVRDLMQWHLIEELEHRTVAFDVYQHVCGSYPYRLVVGTYAQWHMGSWIARAIQYMMSVDPRIGIEFGGVAGAKRRNRERIRMAIRYQLPKVLKTYLPWYTPHDIPMTNEMRQIAEEYSEMAVRTS
jgi:predicted metal-dependent hydrolase